MTHRRILITRQLSIILVAALGASTTLHAQQVRPAGSSTERTLTALENQWAQGVIRRDAAIIKRLVAPRWIYSDESGTMNREQGIAAFTNGPDTVVTAGNDSMRVVSYGGTAVVTGILWMRGHGASGPFDRRYRYTDTWMRLDGRWQCIASQDYLLPETGR